VIDKTFRQYQIEGREKMKYPNPKRERGIANQVIVSMIFALTLAFSPAASVCAGFLLSLTLGNADHISTNQVAFDINALFQGSGAFNNTDYVNSFSFSLDAPGTSIALKAGTLQDYDRFSFDTFRIGWDGGIDPQFGSGGLATVNLPGDLTDDTIKYGNLPVMLARMVIDTSGLAPGTTYTVSLFNLGVSDAAGFIDGNTVASLTTDFPGSVQLNASSSFTITAVPEPSSILYGIAAYMMGIVVHRRKKRKTRVRDQ